MPRRRFHSLIGGAIGCSALALAGAMALGLNPLASLDNQIAIARN